MKVYIIGVGIENKYIKHINNLSHSRAHVSIAATKFTGAIIDGFTHHLKSDCSCALLIPIGMYPASKIIWSKARHVSGKYYIPILNIPLLKQLGISLILLVSTLAWIFNSTDRRKVVVLTSIYLPFLFPLLILKLVPGLKLVAFVPDLPDFEFSYENDRQNLKRLFVPIYIFMCHMLYRIIDYYIFLTEPMRHKFPPRRYEIIEGFADLSKSNYEIENSTMMKSIMYSGALYEKFGIRTLLEAFKNLKGDYELWLFGVGEMTEVIIEAAKQDPRIKFFGNKPNNVVLAYQRIATLLINPRPSNYIFTRYSFPSKIIEYMSSGRPVITTRLECIPPEYNENLFFIDDESESGFLKSIDRVINLPETELSSFGKRAKNFILTSKNSRKRIGDLLASIESLFN